MDRLIFHVDLNSFFASVEQQFNPSLRGKPVGILKALGRTCVIACSNQAKTFGIKTGMSLGEVKTLCPKIILVPANFTRYAAVTQQFIQLMNNFSDVVEVFSLDEVFLDVTYTQIFFGGSVKLAQKIQTKIQSELGECLGVSIGIAKNKFLAKLASSLAQKKGFFVINDQNQNQVLKEAKFADVCGIGRHLSQRLNNLGITSLSQVKLVPQSILQAEFGQFWAKELTRFSQGEDNHSLVTVKEIQPAKSVSRTYTLFATTTNQAVIKALIRNLVEEAVWKLRQMGLVGRQFGLAVRGDHFNQLKHVTRQIFTDSGREVFRQLYTIYNRWQIHRPIRFAGVWISLLTKKNLLPQPLFIADQKQDKILKTVDLINQSYGEYTIYPAALLNQTIIRPEINGYLGDKQFQLKTSWQI
ncbi:MAG: DNA polymerase IV [Candidatus Beckwithbacteria bacterium]|nr:DNA polymerase IV [Candidatus Beckwithbacteria bacterium]